LRPLARAPRIALLPLHRLAFSVVCLTSPARVARTVCAL
jgi:hypothetical protein